MNEKSAAELERDAEIARAKVADTAESIRSKMTPGQIMDEFTGMFSGGDGAATLANLKAQVRDNPLPLTLVGAGLAWLMLGNGSPGNLGGQKGASKPSQHGRPIEDFNYASSSLDRSADAGHGDASIGERVPEAAGSLKDMAADTVGSATEAASNLTASVKAEAGSYVSGAGRMSGRAKETVAELFQRDPLVLAALGLSVGTVIGAMLPSTAVEDEQLGAYRDQLRDAAAGILKEGVEGVKEVAAETYVAVKEEADRQQLSGKTSGSLVDQVSNVVKSAADTIEQGVRQRVDQKART